ncbi:RNA-binding region-containing protein 3-like [Pararge aegeria]|uniref:RNA-binding region-containing protein 3 n=1 Tax=Pararge aegeria aegeria TaxID=348720 RepID=A0A8S4RJX1_9NEOP|nr:RNA-binding region-containing protein 3-like [Pararge aegeria]CAH2237097.1 jg17794 [Pararge aegeria aegeria]
MSKVLIIKHLPSMLSSEDKQQLLKHFGAEQVWETTKKRDYVFASFSTLEKAKSSLSRLHQLEIANRRLVVEYSFEKVPVEQTKHKEDINSLTTNLIKEFLRALNAWNPSVDFYQPPPTHIKYEYPKVTSKTVINIIRALFTHKPFYIQTLHLMNKMSLDNPFSENSTALDFFKETFREYFFDEIPILPPSEPESEISSDETSEKQKQPLPSVTKRKQTLPKTRKRPAAVLSAATIPKTKKPHIVIDQKEVFEGTPIIVESKKISLFVSQDALAKKSEEPEVIGELGKFQKEDQPAEDVVTSSEPDQPTITRKELLKNRISYRDMKVLPVFKNYHPGESSMRLYIKNLAKTVTEQDVKRIYKRYVEHIPEDEQIGFDVRVMQEGRMKGQGFVTFPSVRIAENALNETNGYLLKEKPMVVQFARASNKKTIE